MISVFLGRSLNIQESVSIETCVEELQKRVNALSEDEAYVYEYLKRCYTRRWIAETLFISRAQLGNIEKRLYRKLGVSGIKTMLRIYSQLPNRQFHEPVNADELDDYVERRTEAEIREQLKQNNADLP